MSSCTDWHLGQFISTGRCLTAAHLKLSAHWNETKTVLKLFRSCFVSAKTKRFGGRVIYQKRNRGDFSSGFEYRDNYSAHRTLGFRGTPVETAGVRRRGAADAEAHAGSTTKLSGGQFGFACSLSRACAVGRSRPRPESPGTANRRVRINSLSWMQRRDSQPPVCTWCGVWRHWTEQKTCRHVGGVLSARKSELKCGNMKPRIARLIVDRVIRLVYNSANYSFPAYVSLQRYSADA